MANLIYRFPQDGCYISWTSSSATSPGKFYYGSTAEHKCMFADLKPNTTYTIQRIDASEVFRIGISSRDLMMMKYSSSGSGYVSSAFSWGRRIDSSSPVTFTTGASDIYLTVHYTDSGESGVRVMLNEGTSIQPYEAPAEPARYYMLISQDYPYVENIPDTMPYYAPPFQDYFMKTEQGSYPCIKQLPAMKTAELRRFFPDLMMRCLGADLNSGYPVIMPLEDIVRVRFSDIFFSDTRVTDMFFEDTPVIEGFCGEKKVYGTEYHQLC